MQKQAVTVGIPTVGRVETLPTVLTSLAFQTPVIDEIVILDEAKAPIMESYAVNQALDVLSVQGTRVEIVRSRRRSGIGAARMEVIGEARNELVLMVDDDVAIRPGLVERLVAVQTERNAPWVVPTCFLVPAALELDGYTDRLVNPDDPEVLRWTERYPWFIPYFRYSKPVERSISAAGTQCILLRKDVFESHAARAVELGNLPREDTYMTRVTGPGWFTSTTECLHYEHVSQVDRGNWGKSMFYRLHEAILKNPEGFVDFIGR